MPDNMTAEEAIEIDGNESPAVDAADGSSEPAETTSSDDADQRRQMHWAVESALIFAVGVILALLVRQFLIQAYEIPSTSMVDTLLVGDHVAVNKLSYSDKEIPERGDIVVFHRPEVEQCVFSPTDPKDLIKRVIGLPGETVSGVAGHIEVDGETLNEPWFQDGHQSKEFAPIEVPAGKVLVLGDNRLNSKDGTCFGPISVKSVVGRAFARIWPLGRLGSL